MAQYYKTAEQTHYDYIASTNGNYYNKPATTQIYQEETYDAYGNKIYVEKQHATHGHGYGGHGYGSSYGEVGQPGNFTHGPHKTLGYNNNGYYTKDGVIKTHTDSSFSHGTSGYGAHKSHHGAHASGGRVRRLIRKKRDDGVSDYSSESGSDSDRG